MVGTPPGVGGLRLYRLLLRALRKRGATVEENSRVIRTEVEKGLCRTLVLRDGSRRRARTFVLAAGGVLGGGLLTRPASVQENIFGFPVFRESGPWADTEFFGAHVFARMGLAVNGRMTPLNAAGGEIYTNVHAAGRMLGGYDFAREKSGNGVALTTGRLAAMEALAEL
jgi:glycerol-3-phosphate dehydrogenase subunit B